MAAKKSVKKSAPRSADKASPAETGKLHRAIWYKGRMYDPKKKGDAQAFSAAVSKDKDAAKHLSRMAGKRVVSGFGTTHNADEADDGDAGSAAGGGIDAVEADQVEEEE